jgi:hypothetical protein
VLTNRFRYFYEISFDSFSIISSFFILNSILSTFLFSPLLFLSPLYLSNLPSSPSQHHTYHTSTAACYSSALQALDSQEALQVGPCISRIIVDSDTDYPNISNRLTVLPPPLNTTILFSLLSTPAVFISSPLPHNTRTSLRTSSIQPNLSFSPSQNTADFLIPCHMTITITITTTQGQTHLSRSAMHSESKPRSYILFEQSRRASLPSPRNRNRLPRSYSVVRRVYRENCDRIDHR